MDQLQPPARQLLAEAASSPGRVDEETGEVAAGGRGVVVVDGCAGARLPVPDEPAVDLGDDEVRGTTRQLPVEALDPLRGVAAVVLGREDRNGGQVVDARVAAGHRPASLGRRAAILDP